MPAFDFIAPIYLEMMVRQKSKIILMARLLRDALFLLTIPVAGLLAFSVPPSEVFVGRVVSIEKVDDVRVATNSNGTLRLTRGKLSEIEKDKIVHWERWRAMVTVLKAELWSGAVTNLPGGVSVYYEQDCSTNCVTPYGVEIGHPPRLRLKTNQIYKFLSRCPDSSDFTDKTNAVIVFENGIFPQ